MNNEKRFGVMLDCSRNAVMKVDAIKKFIDDLVIMGYNMLMLYTEDTYEIKSEPLFGRYRGRYSYEELKEIDKYALSKGVEMIPCIQTLAHLDTMFRWQHFSEVQDVVDVLLCGNDKTYELIDNMFKTFNECFTSREIHIGMDEAQFMGLGKYLEEHGYKHRIDMFIEHVIKVCEIAEKYGYTCMIWSDMFYRFFNKGEYYAENTKQENEYLDKIPKNLKLIYFDYYHEEKKVYNKLIKNHKQIGREVWFAGGVWKWLGFQTANKISNIRSKQAILSCKDNGIDNMFFTMWGNDGNETPAYATLPSLFYISEVYKGNTNMRDIKKKFFETFNERYDDFMLCDLVMKFAEGRDKPFMRCGAKAMLFSDCFLGIGDSGVQGTGIEKECYLEYAKKFTRAKKRSNRFAYIFEHYEKLCKLMAVKYDLGYRTRELYQQGDKEGLRNIISDYKLAYRRTKEFLVAFRKMWFEDNKPHGFDAQDIRLGGVIQRLLSCTQRLEAYVNGDIDRIEELEEKLCGIDGGEPDKIPPHCAQYRFEATSNLL